MGEVWAAVYTGHAGFEKEVALKLVHAPSLASQTAVMFIDEARATAALAHPSIVRTLDLGRHGEWVYIAMELVKGVALNALLDAAADANEVMAPAIVAHVGLRLASGLDYAHSFAIDDGQPLRLIHRDVSPHNILVDRSGAVRLTDFGIARTAIQAHVTATRVLRGKPGYFSPEQVGGGALDEKTDVFSTCIVLHECATGERLFTGENLGAMFARLLTQTPPRVDLVRPDFPTLLTDLIEQGLLRDPSDRPTHRELMAGLSAALVGLDGHATVERDLAAWVDRLTPLSPPNARHIGATDSGAVSPTGYDRLFATTAPRAQVVLSNAEPTPTPKIVPAVPLTYRPKRHASNATAIIGLMLAGLAGYGVRDLVEWRAPSTTVSATRTEAPATPGVTARPQRPESPAPKRYLPNPTTGARPVRKTAPADPVSTSATPVADASARAWAQIAEIANSDRAQAEVLRFEYTEALASGAAQRLRSVVERIDRAAARTQKVAESQPPSGR